MIRSGDGMRARFGSGGDSDIERRLPLLAAFVILVFALFVLRLFYLQVIQGDALRDRSERNSVRTLRLEAPRGDILDRHQRTLATTRPAFGVEVIPNELKVPKVTFSTLAILIDGDAGEFARKVGRPRGRERFQAVRLAGDLSYDQRARVESHRYAMPGVVTDVRPRRHYVEGVLAAHLLGMIGEIRRDQLATRRFADYRAGEIIGQSGVEALFERHLRGRAGGQNVVVDVAGREIEVLNEVEPAPGGRLVLALDLDLQRVADAAFRSSDPKEPPKAGAVAVLDPRNGDVLALTSAPTYDPNDFAGGIEVAKWQRLISDPRRPIQNRALAGQYPPGSTYKVIVAAAALSEGLVTPDEKLFCPGHFRLGRRTYRCWRRRGHGELALRDALVRSCDVYFYQLGLRLGVDRLAEYARAAGLGRRTEIAVAPEQPGLVPTEAWKLRRFGEPWQKGETVSAAIGQGFNLVTPLQLAVAFAAIANGGTLLQPRVVLRALDRNGAVVDEPAPEVLGTLPVEPDTLAFIRDALVGVVQEPKGTGGRARVPGLVVGGKTGTSQVVGIEHTEDLEEDEIPEHLRDHAWFVAFAPAEDPEIVVAVLVEHGGHGGSAAAPIAQRILARWFEKRGPAPNVLAAVRPGAAAAVPAGAGEGDRAPD